MTDDLAEMIEEVERAFSIGATTSELQPLIQKLHMHFQMLNKLFEPGLAVYRAIKAHKGRPEFAQEISYPPAAFRLRAGRAHEAGHALFYAAFDIATTLIECGAIPGDYFTVGRWLTRQSILVQHLGYSPSLANRLPADRKMAAHYVQETGEKRDTRIREWHSKVFTAQNLAGDAGYNLTIALTNMMMSKFNSHSADVPSEVAGITYPSVAASLGSDNIALRTSVADRLKLETAMFCEVTTIDQSAGFGKPHLVTYRVIDICEAPAPDGRMSWQPARA